MEPAWRVERVAPARASLAQDALRLLDPPGAEGEGVEDRQQAPAARVVVVVVHNSSSYGATFHMPWTVERRVQRQPRDGEHPPPAVDSLREGRKSVASAACVGGAAFARLNRIGRVICRVRKAGTPVDEHQDLHRRAMELALTHRRMIEAYAFAITRDFHLADDIYQEVALVLMSQCAELPEGDGFMPWLKEVIRRKSRELVRKHGRTARMLSTEALDQVAATLPAEPENGLAEAMARCVDKLQDDARTGILARYVDRLDVPTIAQRLGRTVQGAYAVLKRARLALESCVERARRQGQGA